MELKDKKDIYKTGFNHGYQMGEYLNKGMISSLLINRIVNQQKSIYKSAFVLGVEQKIMMLEKEQKSMHPSLKSVKQELEKRGKDISEPDI